MRGSLCSTIVGDQCMGVPRAMGLVCGSPRNTMVGGQCMGGPRNDETSVWYMVVWWKASLGDAIRAWRGSQKHCVNEISNIGVSGVRWVSPACVMV